MYVDPWRRMEPALLLLKNGPISRLLKKSADYWKHQAITGRRLQIIASQHHPMLAWFLFHLPFSYILVWKNSIYCTYSVWPVSVALKNAPIGQTQQIITPAEVWTTSNRPRLGRLASPSVEDDLLSLPPLMISVVEPFVTVCGERFHLFTHQTLSSGLLTTSSDIHLQ